VCFGVGFFLVGFFKDKMGVADFGFHLCVKYNNLSSFSNYIASAPQDKIMPHFGLLELKYMQSMSSGKQSCKHQPHRGPKAAKTSQAKDYAPCSKDHLTTGTWSAVCELLKTGGCGVFDTDVRAVQTFCCSSLRSEVCSSSDHSRSPRGKQLCSGLARDHRRREALPSSKHFRTPASTQGLAARRPRFVFLKPQTNVPSPLNKTIKKKGCFG